MNRTRTAASIVAVMHSVAQSANFKPPNNHLISLRTPQRSAHVFWQLDSKFAVINDHSGSDTSKVRLVLVRPQLVESDAIEKLVDLRRRRQFHTSEILRQYIVAQGWTSPVHRLVTIHADGLPLGKTEGSAIGFCRG